MSREALSGRDHYRAWREIGTRWSDNDIYGHINNIVYYGWFDTAVNAWLIEAELLDIDRGDLIGLVVETGCRYASPLSFPQRVDIGLAVERIGKSSVFYSLGAFSKNADEASAAGRFVHVYVDRQSRRPTPLPEAWRKALESIAV